MIFRFRYQVLGGHTHVRVFAGPHENALGKCGDLAFRNEEFEIFRRETETDLETAAITRNTIQFLPEPEDLPRPSSSECPKVAHHHGDPLRPCPNR